MERESGTTGTADRTDRFGPAGRSAGVPRGGRRGSDGGTSEVRAELELRLLRLYYWATPLFFLADYAWGVSVRASFLPGSGPRLAYYGFCVLCGLAIHRWPVSAPWVGMGESAVNLLLLVLGVMLPIYGMQDAVLEGGTLVAPMTGARLVNVMLSGTVLVVSFHRNQRRLAVAGGRAGRILAGGPGGGWREKG